MLPKQDPPIQLSEINAFLAKGSDFSFEMTVLKQIRGLEFTCSHSATYNDPVTSKARQYDIRAYKLQDNRRLNLSVECKCLFRSTAILVHTTARRSNESYHQVLRSIKGLSVPQVRLIKSGSGIPYPEGQVVGKKLNLLSRKKGSLSGRDDEFFERLSQAQNSAFDVIQYAARASDGEVIDAIVPILVIPDETLWCVDYTSDGDRSEPQQREQISFFIGQGVTLHNPMQGGAIFNLSHLEIVTFKRLQAHLTMMMNSFFNV